MTKERALTLLARENPVREEDLPGAQALHVSVLRERILLDPKPRAARRARGVRRISAAALALAMVVAAAALALVGSPGRGGHVEDAVAAVRNAGAVSAESAERSGTAVVRITHGGEIWGARTIAWNGQDLSVTNNEPDRQGRVGSKELVVDGIMYGIDPEDGAWVSNGSVESIDPGSGTTPDETLAALREDVGGATLRRITGGMTDLETRGLDDGSTVYSGSVEARLIARESGFKEGQAIRVLPFGWVAHDEAAHPRALLHAEVTVGPDGVVRDIAVSWGTWIYHVVYSRLGTTPAPEAPPNPRPLRRG